MSMTFEQICKRAGGRRRYNADRREAAVRRLETVHKLAKVGMTQREISAFLHVSPSTISRDQKRLNLLISQSIPPEVIARMTVHQVDKARYSKMLQRLAGPWGEWAGRRA